MDSNKDDVFIWPDAWAYRGDADAHIAYLGQPDQILVAETPEWVDFMENEA